MTMTTEEFNNIGNAMFGSTRWGSRMSAVTGLSQPTISNAMRGKAISEKTAAAVRNAYEAFQSGEVFDGNHTHHVAIPVIEESDDQVKARIDGRFRVMNQMAKGIIQGKIKSMIVSGAPGLGKSYDIEKLMEQQGDDFHYDIIKGGISAVGLYSSLYKAREGGVVIIDDCDGVFNDEDSMNILKSALDSTDKRVLSWRKKSSFIYDPEFEEEEDGMYPNIFQFDGAVIFITNLDFQDMSERGNKLSPHFSALISRSMYVDLTMQTLRERMIRLESVFLGPMHKTLGLSIEEAHEIFEFVVNNKQRFREISLRLMKHIADTYSMEGWRDIIEVTKMR